MSYLRRAPGMHHCICGWEGKLQPDKKVKKPVDKCPMCSEKTALIPLREIPGYCFCCASTSGKLQIIDHTMVRECRICGARLNLHTVKPWIWEVMGMEQAILKLKTEMEGAKDNLPVLQIGNYLLQLIETNPAAVEKILVEGKTISKSLDAMAAVAQKKAVNRKAIMTDEEGYEEVRKYYGIQGDPAPAPVAVVTAPAASVPPSAPVIPPPAFGLDVTDLFGDL